jgi:NADP-dependent 3-hydroxy acid dehydrogenase YdfG
MKVVITGHVSGIGKAIFETFNNNGLECVGYDIQNGKDLNDTRVVEELLLECQSSDVFINNALLNQVYLLSKIHDMWLGKNKVIVNLSSAVTYLYNETNYPADFAGYFQHKRMLDNLCKDLTLNKFPYIMNVRPSWVDTQLASHIEGDKIKPNDLAELIYFHVANKEKYQVIDIVIR